MTSLRLLGATSILVAGGFTFLTTLHIGIFAQIFAWCIVILLGLHALSIMIKVMNMASIRAQFLRDPELGEEAFTEVEQDMAEWAKVQFGKLTRFTFILTSIFGVTVWVPALSA